MASLHTPYDDIGDDDIRLVSLNNSDGGTISLSLQTYPKTLAPQYAAVSYAWGNDKSITTIQCNGCKLEIRTNLAEALPFLFAQVKLPLWIDAICLDQQDVQEKAQQVPLMGDTYQGAAQTLIWLGTVADDSDLAIDNMDILTQALLVVDGYDTWNAGLEEFLAQNSLPSVEDAKWKALQKIQQRPWFFRLWTLQEVVLSKDPTLVCGSKSIPWNSLVALHQAAMQAKLYDLVKEDAPDDYPYQNSQIFVSNVNFLRELQDGRTGIINLPMLLLLSADRRFTEPVDRVWALLGLLNKNYRLRLRELDVVDYDDFAKINYHITFMKIMQLHIRYDKILAMRLIEDNLRTRSHPSLPSWCPDWYTMKGGVPMSRWPEARAGLPGGYDRALKPIMNLTEKSCLEIYGFEVDVIEAVTTSQCENVLSSASYVWFAKCLRMVKDSPGHAKDVHRSTQSLSAFFKSKPGDLPVNASRQWFDSAKGVLQDVLWPPELKVDPTVRNISKCNRRNFFGTKSGRFGLGPLDLLRGDRVCVIYGATTVFFLRQLGETSQDTEAFKDGESLLFGEPKDREYELVGCGYIPSLFRGEAFVGRSCESLEKFRIW